MTKVWMDFLKDVVRWNFIAQASDVLPYDRVKVKK